MLVNNHGHYIATASLAPYRVRQHLISTSTNSSFTVLDHQRDKKALQGHETNQYTKACLAGRIGRGQTRNWQHLVACGEGDKISG